MGVFISTLAKGWLPLLLTAACAYMLGSLSFAIIVTRLIKKEDIRDSGSGNAGATNVLRSQGALPAVLTTLGDLAKAVASVLVGGLLVRVLCAGYPQAELESLLLVGRYIAGLFCMLGHLYPLYFGFRGGKGVLATFGVMLVLDWKVALLCLSVFILVVFASRLVSLGSIFAAAALPILTGVFSGLVYKEPTMGDTIFCTGMTLIIAVILIYKHRANIVRIKNGTESKIGVKKEK